MTERQNASSHTIPPSAAAPHLKDFPSATAIDFFSDQYVWLRASLYLDFDIVMQLQIRKIKSQRLHLEIHAAVIRIMV